MVTSETPYDHATLSQALKLTASPRIATSKCSFQHGHTLDLHIRVQRQRLDSDTPFNRVLTLAFVCRRLPAPFPHSIPSRTTKRFEKRKIERERGKEKKDTHVLAGFTSPQYVVYTSFILAKSSISARKTLTSTTCSRLDPAASRMVPKFLMHWCCQ